MEKKTFGELVSIAKKHQVKNDISHGFNHVQRVLANAMLIANEEGGDMDVVIPAALFHDIVMYHKDDPRSPREHKESAMLASEILAQMNFPKEKIGRVSYAIESCSFTRGINPVTLEAKILQDADMLESTGAISLMRAFASAGMLSRNLYDSNDTFCRSRKPEPLVYGLDLLYLRLLKIKGRLHTKTAKRIGLRRHKFLLKFISELKEEFRGYLGFTAFSMR
ncbi:MAG: HD domain-containing protein [Candidatus Micrarchaeota archaeon]|nr:HD domain-containing protein [Candidatus Micrarchaeota archaeon]MDE1864176.1 HD domain-containing protein [Candidatus Micrarchaeota archaeon]